MEILILIAYIAISSTLGKFLYPFYPRITLFLISFILFILEKGKKMPQNQAWYVKLFMSGIVALISSSLLHLVINYYSAT